MQDEFKYDNFDRQNFSITVVGPDNNLEKGPHETMKEIMKQIKIPKKQIEELEDKVSYSVKELRDILKVYHYKSDTENMSKDVVTSLENLLGRLLK